jgi:hypothetical protein
MNGKGWKNLPPTKVILGERYKYGGSMCGTEVRHRILSKIPSGAPIKKTRSLTIKNNELLMNNTDFH